MTIFERIVKWNEERGLIAKGHDHYSATLMLAEELDEFLGYMDATALTIEATKHYDENLEPTDNQKADALCDLIVIATGELSKMGFDPDKAMAETLKEIESRKGKVNPETGKWQKVITGNEYKADYTECKKVKKGSK